MISSILRNFSVIFGCGTIFSLIITWATWTTTKSFQVSQVSAQIEEHKISTNRDIDYIRKQLEYILQKQDVLTNRVQDNQTEILSKLQSADEKINSVMIKMKISNEKLSKK